MCFVSYSPTHPIGSSDQECRQKRAVLMMQPIITVSRCKPEVNTKLTPMFSKSRLLDLLHLDIHPRGIIGRTGIGRIRQGGRIFGLLECPVLEYFRQ